MAEKAARPAPGRELPLLLEDDALMAIDKPAGVAVHGGSGVSFGVIEQLRRARPALVNLELVHRLDRETSGCLVLGRTKEALKRLGKQFAEAGVSEARVTKLLVSRGDAFLQIVPRLLRLLASRQVQPNWYTFSALIRHNDSEDSHEQAKVEALRLHIAGQYFSAMTRNAT